MNNDPLLNMYLMRQGLGTGGMSGGAGMLGGGSQLGMGQIAPPMQFAPPVQHGGSGPTALGTMNALNQMGNPIMGAFGKSASYDAATGDYTPGPQGFGSASLGQRAGGLLGK